MISQSGYYGPALRMHISEVDGCLECLERYAAIGILYASVVLHKPVVEGDAGELYELCADLEQAIRDYGYHVIAFHSED